MGFIANHMKYKDKKLPNFKGFWLRLWDLLTPLHSKIKVLVVFITVLELIRLVGPYILKLIIDLITDFREENLIKIFFLIALMFLVNQLAAAVDYFADKKMIAAMAESEKYLLTISQRKMMELSLSYHERENTGSKIAKIQRGVDKINQLLGNIFWDVSPTLIQIFLTTLFLFFVDYRFGLLLMFFVPLFIALTLSANKKVFPYRKKRQDDFEKSSGMMAQSVINIYTVKSFVQEEREEKEFSSIIGRIKENVIKEFNIIFNYNWGRNLVIDLGRVSILFFGIFLVWKGGITIGSLVFVVTISEKALLSLFRISRLYDRIMESSEAIDRIYYLKREKTEIVNPENGIKPKSLDGKINFKEVSFSYSGAREKALEKVDLTINSGCITALVGPSGGGKTTVAKMIYRHYDPQSGEVLVDGVNVKKYDLYSLRKFIAIVPQEVEIFNTSIRENIAYSCPSVSFREIEAAAKIANVDEFIDKMSEGYNTMVGERGIKLSGGQRQRVGIARAVLANPKILIFDEATSNLDSHSEMLIQEAMEKISKGRTMVIIAHRFSTIKKADKIIVLENGQVVEKGSHFELSNTKGGLYSKLLRLQKLGDVS